MQINKNILKCPICFQEIEKCRNIAIHFNEFNEFNCENCHNFHFLFILCEYCHKMIYYKKNDSIDNNGDISHNIIHSHLNDENKSHQPTESIPTEELFLKQKEKIKIYKEKNKKNQGEIKLNLKNDNLFSNKSMDLLKTKNNNKVIINNVGNLGNGNDNLKPKRIFNGTFKTLTLDNFQFFENTYFQIKVKSSGKEDSIPLLKNVFCINVLPPHRNIKSQSFKILVIFSFPRPSNTRYSSNINPLNFNASISICKNKSFFS